jgi:hypothetical protein
MLLKRTRMARYSDTSGKCCIFSALLRRLLIKMLTRPDITVLVIRKVEDEG